MAPLKRVSQARAAAFRVLQFKQSLDFRKMLGRYGQDFRFLKKLLCRGMNFRR